MVLHLERFKYTNENYYRDFYKYESYVKGLIKARKYMSVFHRNSIICHHVITIIAKPCEFCFEHKNGIE